MEDVTLELEEFLRQREQEHAMRTLSPVPHGNYVDFSSNDYLGLSSHADLINAARDALDRYGAGASASRLMSGDTKIHHALEEETAAFKGKERALVFNSGYQANVGIIPAMVNRRSAVFADRLVHASLLDGISLSHAKLFRFRHNDIEHLKSLLGSHRGEFETAMIITESVFSMDGDRAPLADLVDLKNRHRCILFVDEAHATGIFGPQGKGCVNLDGLTDEVELVMGTFSKALGGFGGYLASSHTVVEYLVNAARSFIYSTALPAMLAAADLAAIRLLAGGLERGPALLQKAEDFREMLRHAGISVLGSSQIVPVVVGESEKAALLSETFLRHGVRVLPVRPPTVPAGAARLRFGVCHAHSHDQLRSAAEVLRELA